MQPEINLEVEKWNACDLYATACRNLKVHDSMRKNKKEKACCIKRNQPCECKKGRFDMTVQENMMMGIA